MKGETESEITEGARVLRSKAGTIDMPDELREQLVDTCGTGGDGHGTFNISTAVAFVVAACGVPVAKHGNRAVSSKSGSADVLEKLGINLRISSEDMVSVLQQCNLGFFLAPLYHKTMRHVGPVRQELGVRTIFNILGPLSNPAGAQFQLLGVYDRRLAEVMAHVLKNLGATRAWVVHGLDGLDELTLTRDSFVAELKDGRVSTFSINPEEVGLEKCDMSALKGGDAEHNAAALEAIVRGQASAYQRIVVLNAAAALHIAGKVESLRDGVILAQEALDSGAAATTLRQFVALTNEMETL